jgi:RNA polymerase sigma-70 factor (ECF subfamily)
MCVAHSDQGDDDHALALVEEAEAISRSLPSSCWARGGNGLLARVVRPAAPLARNQSRKAAAGGTVDPDREDAVRLRKGDISGLAGLMQRHQDRLFRYLLRLLGGEPMAEDVFQQAWVQVAEQISRYDPERPFAPWLFTLARNLALDQLRRLRPARLEEAAEPEAPARDDPHVRAVAGQRSSRLAAAVAELAALDREVISLRFDGELELPQLAATLGVPLPTAKARLYRALARLRARLVARSPAGEWR